MSFSVVLENHEEPDHVILELPLLHAESIKYTNFDKCYLYIELSLFGIYRCMNTDLVIHNAYLSRLVIELDLYLYVYYLGVISLMQDYDNLVMYTLQQLVFLH